MNKSKNIVKFTFTIIIILFIVYWLFHTINENKQEIITITMEKEPDFISTANNRELITVVDDQLVLYDSKGNTKTIQPDINIAKAYPCGEKYWIIDDKANLYTLQIIKDDRYEMSDIILDKVDYITGNDNYALAISTEGELYVWGKGDEYYSIGIGENVEIKEPLQIEGIGDAKEVVRFGTNTAVLTETGELYAVGGMISTEWSEEKQEYIDTKFVIKEFTKVKCDSIITHIGEYEGLYTINESGIAVRWGGIKLDDDGNVILDPGYNSWDYDLAFKQISFGDSFVIGIDISDDIYYWGFDFTTKMEQKADYTIHTTPQLLEFDKAVESVYAVGDVAFLKNGLKLYIISD